MSDSHLTIYCDESIETGRHYSDFYGGLLLQTSDVQRISHQLATFANSINLTGEIKWSKVSARYLDKYIQFIDYLWPLLERGDIKIRIMFRQSAIQATGLTAYSRHHGYFLLYYQFIKHAFGLAYAPPPDGPTRLRLFFDELPDRKEKANLFKDHILSLPTLKAFKANQILLDRRDIGEINSKNHILLQSLDVILGAMAFRLNDMHLIKPTGQKRRGKKTIAKEKLYKHINKKIRTIYPRFNIGISTGKQGSVQHIFADPYRHWRFVPKDFTIDPSKFK